MEIDSQNLGGGPKFRDHLLVKLSEVKFRKSAILLDEFKAYKERSKTVRAMLGYTTRRVAAFIQS